MPLSTAFLYDEDIGVTPADVGETVGFGVDDGLGVDTGFKVGDFIGLLVGAAVGDGVIMGSGVSVICGMIVEIGVTVGKGVSVSTGLGDAVISAISVWDTVLDCVLVIIVTEGAGFP
jgi:hypothetical protein